MEKYTLGPTLHWEIWLSYVLISSPDEIISNTSYLRTVLFIQKFEENETFLRSR